MNIQTLIILSIFSFIIYQLWKHNNIGLIARRAARKHCEKLGVQYLDEYVILKHFKLKPSKHAIFRLYRVYSFEFSSTGDYRYKGQISLINAHVVNITLEPFKTGHLEENETPKQE